MIPALSLLLAATAQTPTPIRPAGVSPEFNETLNAIEVAVKAADYAKADRLLDRLPKDILVYKWDDSKVPANLRADYAKERDKAIREWMNYAAGLKVKEGPKPSIVFAFEPELAANAETGNPLGLATFVSNDPSKPRLEAVIGLKRGKPKKATSPLEIGNEVRFVLGKALGLGSAPMFGPATSRTDVSTNFPTRITNQEMRNASQVRNYVRYLRQAIEKRQPVVITHPKAYTDTVAIDLGTLSQGQVMGAAIQLTNNGDGPLSFSILPDCGCISLTTAGTVDAGTTKLIKAEFDSIDLSGEVNKKLMVYTNDPDKGSFVVPLKANVLPAYRFLSPEGEVVVANGRKAKASVYLVVPEGSDLQPTRFQLDGMKGNVSHEKWSGTLADPERNEEAKPRKGYKIEIDIDDVMPMGRAGLTLTVDTNSRLFPNLMYNFYIQKGIIALPVRVYLGELGQKAKETVFMVSRPGRPFKITGVASSSPNLKATYKPTEENGDYMVAVVYDGKAIKGDLDEKITVKTDDPEQPIVEVPVTGRVK